MTMTTASLGRHQYIADTTSPQIRPAGLTTAIIDTAKDALTWGPRPATPDEQKKYRALSVHEPGKIVKHWGMAGEFQDVLCVYWMVLSERIPARVRRVLLLQTTQCLLDLMGTQPRASLMRLWQQT